MNTDILSKLYNDIIGQPPAKIIELPASGSNRRYFRLEGPQSIIGAIGTSREENEAFIYMADKFNAKGFGCV